MGALGFIGLCISPTWIMASVGVHQIEKFVADSAVDVVDVDVVVDADGRLEQPRRLFINC